GVCSVTAGRPNGQRTTTRRNARGGRPSCRSTRARSSSMPFDRSSKTVPPLLDPLDDEELLARADVPQAARLARELGRARRELEAPFERLLLGLERVHLRSPCVQRVVRRDPAPQRPVVEQRDEQDRAHREPAAEQERTGW